MKEWLEWLSGLDRPALLRAAKSVWPLNGADDPEDAVQEVMLKALDPDFRKKVRHAEMRRGVPPEVYLMKVVRNQRKDSRKRKRPQSLDDPERLPGDASAGGRGLGRMAWLRDMLTLLDRREVGQGEKDCLMLAKHRRFLPIKAGRKLPFSRRLSLLMRLSRVLAILGSPDEPLYLTDRERALASRWARHHLAWSIELLSRANRPGRRRPLRKLVVYAEALNEAAMMAAYALRVEWLASATLRGEAPIHGEALLRIAAGYFVRAFDMMLASDPRLEKCWLDYCAGRKRGASGRNGHG
jgi:hypothetical protein